jgi:hypothetical protein
VTPGAHHDALSPYLHVLILIFMNYHRFFSLILLSGVQSVKPKILLPLLP